MEKHKDSTKGWTIVTEQTVARLQGLQEEHIDSWQLAWDEVDDMHLEGEEVQADADMAAPTEKAGCLGGKLGKMASSHPGIHTTKRQR